MSGWWAASFVVLWVLVVVLCVVVVALARQIGTLHLRLGPRGALEIDDEGPPIGEAPLPVTVPDVGGENVIVGGPGQRQLLLFVSPGCRMCDTVLPAVDALAASHSLVPYVVADADRTDTLSAVSRHRIRARVVAAPEVVRSYDVPGTPYAVILDERGIVKGKGTINNLEQMEGLIDTAERRTVQTSESLPAT